MMVRINIKMLTTWYFYFYNVILALQYVMTAVR